MKLTNIFPCTKRRQKQIAAANTTTKYTQRKRPRKTCIMYGQNRRENVRPSKADVWKAQLHLYRFFWCAQGNSGKKCAPAQHFTTFITLLVTACHSTFKTPTSLLSSFSLSCFHGLVNTSFFQPPNQAPQFSPVFYQLQRLGYVATPFGGHPPQSVTGYEPHLPIVSGRNGGHPTHTKGYRGFPVGRLVGTSHVPVGFHATACQVLWQHGTKLQSKTSNMKYLAFSRHVSGAATTFRGMPRKIPWNAAECRRSTSGMPR